MVAWERTGEFAAKQTVSRHFLTSIKGACRSGSGPPNRDGERPFLADSCLLPTVNLSRENDLLFIRYFVGNSNSEISAPYLQLPKHKNRGFRVAIQTAARSRLSIRRAKGFCLSSQSTE